MTCNDSKTCKFIYWALHCSKYMDRISNVFIPTNDIHEKITWKYTTRKFSVKTITWENNNQTTWHLGLNYWITLDDCSFFPKKKKEKKEIVCRKFLKRKIPRRDNARKLCKKLMEIVHFRVFDRTNSSLKIIYRSILLSEKMTD